VLLTLTLDSALSDEGAVFSKIAQLCDDYLAVRHTIGHAVAPEAEFTEINVAKAMRTKRADKPER